MITSSQEERFSAFLQPIRDLAKNWNIDIAHYLEEYLEDLEKIEIVFDDGATTMNFSEAALLIQGSAGVYAKKVEYLYGLVYQVLDMVTQKKKQKGKSGEGEDNEDGEDAGGEDEFLQLNDIDEGDGSYVKELDTSTSKTVQLMPQTPSCLIPLEEAEKEDHPSYNNKGEIMGNYFDFIVNTSHICKDGSLLLEHGDRALLQLADMQQHHILGPVEEELSRCDSDSLAIQAQDDVFDNEDDSHQRQNVEGVVDHHPTTDADAVRTGTVHQQRQLRKRTTFAVPLTKPANDPWKLLNPYDDSKVVEKPLKKKIPYKIPAGLDDGKTKKRKKKGETKKELAPLHEVVEKLFSCRQSFPKNPLKVPEFLELDGAFWAEYKRREKLKKERIKQLRKEEQLEEQEITMNELMEGDNNAELIGNEDEDDVDIPDLELHADLFGQGQICERLTLGSDTGYQTPCSDDLTMSYEELVRRHVEKFLASANEYIQVTELSRRVSEWEEKIKPRLLEEEKHEPFDIHKYGTYIIGQMVRGKKYAFRDLVKGKSEYEVCRYTLAVLQLANVYNVELEVIPDTDGSIIDRLFVTLLSTKRHYEDLQEYQAPSMKEV